MAFLGPAITTGAEWLAGDTWAAFAARVALQIGLAYAAQQYEARKVNADNRTSREVLVRSATQPKSIVLGRAFVAGLIAYTNARPVPGSHDNYELYVQIVHAGHKCADIEELVFDDVRITAAQIDWGASASPIGLGHVSGGRYGVLIDGPSNLWAVHLEKHLNGERSPMLEKAGFGGDITSAHKMTGNCTGVYRFIAASKSEEIFSSGPPTVIKALVKGALIYDPRKDSTNGGSGSHRLADETTWEWSDNPILCVCYYMLKVMGVVSSRIDWATVITQANVCDILVPIPPASSPTHYEKRYTCNGMITTGASDQENLSAILSSCLGNMSLEGGKFKPRAGAYASPDVTITVDDIIGNVGIATAPSRAERYNMVTGTYFSSDDTAQQVDFMPVTDSGFLTRDNGVEIRKSIELPMTNSEYMAQRIARKLLNQSDNMITVTLPMRWTGLQLTPNSYINLTYPELSWTNKVFRVTGFTLGSGDAPINVIMTEDNSTAWDDPSVSNYSVRASNGIITRGTDMPISTRPTLVNILPSGYYDNELLSIDFYTNQVATIAFDTTYFYIGSRSIKLTGVSGNGGFWGVSFTPSQDTFYNLFFAANRRFIAVAAVRCNQYCSAKAGLYGYLGDAAGSLTSPVDVNSRTSGPMTTPATDTWGLVAFEFTPTSATNFNFQINFINPVALGGTPIMWLDAIQMWDVTDRPDITTTVFQTTSSPATGANVRLADDATAIAGTSTVQAVTPASLAATLDTLPFSSVFNASGSTQKSIAATGSQAHSLGSKPTWVQASLLCTSGEKGFSTGDEYFGGLMDGAGQMIGWSADATNIYWASNSSTWFISNRQASTWTAITNANWKLILRAGFY